MDLLDDWMRTLRGEGLIRTRTRTDVAGSWGFAVPSGVGIVVHLIALGSAWLRVAGQPPQLLGSRPCPRFCTCRPPVWPALLQLVR